MNHSAILLKVHIMVVHNVPNSIKTVGMIENGYPDNEYKRF